MYAWALIVIFIVIFIMFSPSNTRFDDLFNDQTSYSYINQSPQFQRTQINVKKEIKHLSHIELCQWVKNHAQPFHLMILNCNGNLNIGMMIRSAMAFGCAQIYLVGKRKFDSFEKCFADSRSAVGAHKYTSIEHFAEIHDPSFFAQRNLYPVWMEQNGASLEQHSMHYMLQEHLPLTPCFVMGSEGEGISSEFMHQFPKPFYHLSINHPGLVPSLNVSSACAIVLYEFYKQTGFKNSSSFSSNVTPRLATDYMDQTLENSRTGKIETKF